MPMMVVNDKAMKVPNRSMPMLMNVGLRAFPTFMRMLVMRTMLTRMKMIHFGMQVR